MARGRKKVQRGMRRADECTPSQTYEGGHRPSFYPLGNLNRSKETYLVSVKGPPAGVTLMRVPRVPAGQTHNLIISLPFLLCYHTIQSHAPWA
jgi:hypothetical protein